MRVETLSWDPLVQRLYDFCTADEASALVARAEKIFTRSRVTCANPAGCVDASRTSSTANMPTDDAVTCVIRARASSYSGLARSESLQIVRYFPGEEFKPHLDAFSTSSASGLREIRTSGQRAATFLVYLNEPEEGGATIFPKLGLSVRPIARSAVFWRYKNASDPRVLHGGAPVARGVKYAANVWMKG